MSYIVIRVLFVIHMLRFFSALFMLILSNSAVADDRQSLLSIEIFELPLSDKSFDITAIVDTDVGNPEISAIHKNQRLDGTIEPRRRDTSPIVNFDDNKILVPEQSTQLLIRATIRDSSTGEVLYHLPTVIHEIDHDRDRVSIDIRDSSFKPRRTRLQAFSESFPFFVRGTRNTITSENLIESFNAIRMLVRDGSASSEEWGTLYDVFVQNADLVAKRQDFLRVVIELLQNNSNLDSNGYVDFYFQFLNSILENEIGAFTLVNDIGISQHIFDEQKDMLQNATVFSFEHLNNSLDIYEKKREYEKCLEISRLAFKWIEQSVKSAPHEWMEFDKRYLAEELYNAMISSTVCARRLYAVTEEDVEILSTRSVSKWLSQNDFSEFQSSFVYLYETLREVLDLQFIDQSVIRTHIAQFDPFVANRGNGV